MRKSLKTLALASTLIAGLAAAPALYAHDSGRSDESKMQPGMTMGQGGMMGMMGQMSGMMEGCSKMMQSMTDRDRSGRPNGQWKKEMPGTPKKNG